MLSRMSCLGARLHGCDNTLHVSCRDPDKVAKGYTLDTRWRNRVDFVKGRDEAEAFLRAKWAKELEYRLIKELWAVDSDRLAVRCAPAIVECVLHLCRIRLGVFVPDGGYVCSSRHIVMEVHRLGHFFWVPAWYVQRV